MTFFGKQRSSTKKSTLDEVSLWSGFNSRPTHTLLCVKLIYVTRFTIFMEVLEYNFPMGEIERYAIHGVARALTGTMPKASRYSINLEPLVERDKLTRAWLQSWSTNRIIVVASAKCKTPGGGDVSAYFDPNKKPSALELVVESDDEQERHLLAKLYYLLLPVYK